MAKVELDEVDGAGDVAVVGGDVADFDHDSEYERDQKEERGEEGEREAGASCGFDGRFGWGVVGCWGGLVGPVGGGIEACGLAWTTDRGDFWKCHWGWRRRRIDWCVPRAERERE